MNRNIALAIFTVLVLGAGALVWWNLKPVAASYPIEFAAGEEVANWNFQGAYTGNAELAAKAETEIERLEDVLGTGEYPDYTIYMSIANQYHLLGDGKRELAYIQYALAQDSETSGLPWGNAGVLFETLGALNTARMAYERAALVQPIRQYREAYIDFLKRHFPQDAAAALKAQQETGVIEFPQ
jgi:hypothetical protein